jgi:hypothetical protein
MIADGRYFIHGVRQVAVIRALGKSIYVLATGLKDHGSIIYRAIVAWLHSDDPIWKAMPTNAKMQNIAFHSFKRWLTKSIRLLDLHALEMHLFWIFSFTISPSLERYLVADKHCPQPSLHSYDVCWLLFISSDPISHLQYFVQLPDSYEVPRMPRRS